MAKCKLCRICKKHKKKKTGYMEIRLNGYEKPTNINLSALQNRRENGTHVQKT